MKNRTVITNPTNVQLEAQAVCRVLNMVKCPSIEFQRYEIMQLWAQEFSRLKFTGSSLSAYFDKLVKAALAYQSPADQFRSAFLYIFDNELSTLVFQYYHQGFGSYVINKPYWSFVAFNSSKLKIECSIENQSLKWANITFKLPKGSSPAILSLNVSVSSIRDYKNG